MKVKGFLFLFLVLMLSGAVRAQKEKLTVEEEKAFTDIRQRFISKLDVTGELDPLVVEMFVPDFGARYAKERRSDLDKSPAGNSRSMFFGPGLEFTPNLLDEASDADWRELHLAYFNFMHYTAVVTLNRMAELTANGKEADDDQMEATLKDVFSKAVVDLFAKDPILKDFIEKKQDTQPMRTVADMQRVTKLMREAKAIVTAKFGAAGTKFSARVKKLSDDGLAKNAIEPGVDTADRETYGFPKGTRLITFFPDMMMRIVFVKVGDQYKIVSAEMTSID